jgi:hypothetical protein
VHHCKLYSETSGSDFVSSGELLGKNYAKTTQSREQTNNIKMYEKFKTGLQAAVYFRPYE